MRRIRDLGILALFFLIPGAALSATPAQHAGILAASEGHGTIELLWTPIGPWPRGGFRLERVVGRTREAVARRIEPMPALAMNLSKEDQTLLGKLVAALAHGEPSRQITIAVAMRSALEPTFGDAAGLRAHDRAQHGPRRYRLSGLDPSGKILWSVETALLDPGAMTPLPPTPKALTAVQRNDGLLLSWDAPAKSSRAYAFRVGRSTGSASFAPLTSEPRLSLHEPGSKRRSFIDPHPRIGKARYRVRWVDALGRSSAPAQITVRIRDMAALAPPERVTAVAKTGRIELRWQAKSTKATDGYRIERARLIEGPFVPVTLRPLPRTANAWMDTSVQEGSAYFYRLRSLVGKDVGTASLVASAVARSQSPPTTPRGLTARAGRTRVRLTWRPAAHTLAGYLIERQTPSGHWVDLNAKLSQETRYDDLLGSQDGGTLHYRVIAVAFDNQMSKPSRPVSVELQDTVPPDPPRLLAIDGANGVVELHFTAAPPVEETRRILVLRSRHADDVGVVIGQPLTGSDKKVDDPFVRPGQDYYYRLVALDAAGNRSTPSSPLHVVVEPPPIPVAPAPKVEWQVKPFPRVAIRFPQPPAGYSVIVQRRIGGERSWVVLGAPTQNPKVFDIQVPEDAGKIRYRIVYQADSGERGAPSSAVSIERGRRAGS